MSIVQWCLAAKLQGISIRLFVFNRTALGTTLKSQVWAKYSVRLIHFFQTWELYPDPNRLRYLIAAVLCIFPSLTFLLHGLRKLDRCAGRSLWTPPPPPHFQTCTMFCLCTRLCRLLYSVIDSRYELRVKCRFVANTVSHVFSVMADVATEPAPAPAVSPFVHSSFVTLSFSLFCLEENIPLASLSTVWALSGSEVEGSVCIFENYFTVTLLNGSSSFAANQRHDSFYFIVLIRL